MRNLALALLIVLGACINSPTAKLVPMEPVEPTTAQWPAAALSIQHADGLLIGYIEEMEEYWAYDDPCGLIMILRHGCDGTVTYQIHLVNATDDHWVYAFTPAYGTFGLYRGEKAVFLWHKSVVYRYQECKEHQGMGGYCNYDIVDAFQSDFDVLPVVDSTKVDSIFQKSR